MKLPVVFLCGDRSPYGLAHLQAIAEHFDLRAVVVADRSRWDQFRSALLGGMVYTYRTPVDSFLQTFKSALKWLVSSKMEMLHQRRLKEIGVPIYVINDVNSQVALDLLRSLSPQVLISAAYPQILKKPLLDIAPRGAINFHPSLLPRCRGAHPHYWSLAEGETLGGVSAHFMTERIDDGDIIAQRPFDLSGLYYKELYQRIIEETPSLVAAVSEFLSDDNAKPVPQDASLATVFRNDREIHHRLDFSRMHARQLHDRIRAGAAFGLFRGRRIQFERAEIAEHNRHMTNDVELPPGVIVDVDDTGIWVTTNDRRFLIINALMEKDDSISFGQWIGAHSVRIGERFE